MAGITAGDLLVQVMREHDVGTAFGIVSIHNLPLVEAVDRDLRFVPVRHEAAAVNAADGYARASGGLGVAITSTGTGAGNAAGALIEALSASSRVLHVTGQIDSGYLGQGRGVIHETKDQFGLLSAVSKHAATVVSAADAAHTLRTAAAAARSVPFGPASVEWPTDLQYLPPPPADLCGRPIPRQVPNPPEDNAIDEVVTLVERAQRPLIWAGGGARGIGAPLRQFAQVINAGLLTSNSGRGVVPEDDEIVIGNFASSAAGAQLLKEADLLIAIGTHFRSTETQHYQLRLPDRVVQVDIDPNAIGRVYPATVGVVADAGRAVHAILKRLTAATLTTDRKWADAVAATRRQVRADLAAEIGSYQVICQAMRRHLPRASPIARDVTIPTSWWGNRLLDIYAPETNVFAVGGGIGQGIAMGVGAGLAVPDVPTLVMVGDGGLAVHLGELATIAQEQVPMIVVVFNDGGYGVLRDLQDTRRERRSAVDLVTPDIALLAASVGLAHRRVGAADEFESAFVAALSSGGPNVIEVEVAALGPFPGSFAAPVAVAIA